MQKDIIQCPKCGTQIELTEALTGRIEQVVRVKYEAEAAAKERDYQSRLKAVQEQAKSLEAKQRAIDDEVAEKLKAERVKLAEQKKALETQQQQIAEQVAEQVKAERKRIAEGERAKILAEQAGATKILQDELTAQKKALAAAQQNELALRRERQKLEEEKQAFELSIQRKMDEERKQIEDKARQKALDEQALRAREKDDKIEAMTRQINDLQRKAEQGSQEAQGEALEGALLDGLRLEFPFDVFEEVKKGQRGADIVQTVRNPQAKECGKILWESKYTKAFAGGWVEKLKTDQQEAGAALAVLATVALPKEIKNFGAYDGVWVTDYTSALGLAAALRIGLIGAARERALAVNRGSVKDLIYGYVTGQEFGMQVRAIAEAFGRLKSDLDKEKQAMERVWKSREKQLEVVLGNIAGIRGSLEGYAGKSLPGMGGEIEDGSAGGRGGAGDGYAAEGD